jgi:hypothetical protein
MEVCQACFNLPAGPQDRLNRLFNDSVTADQLAHPVLKAANRNPTDFQAESL